jgi:predicted GNAT family acetyltransferase
MSPALRRDETRHRYELLSAPGVGALDPPAFAVFHEQPGALVITHTEVPRELRGEGIGGELVKAVLDDMAARGLKVVPRCPFVADWIEKHPDYRKLLA